MENKAFWEEQARKFGSSSTATNFDPNEEQLEFHFLEELVPRTGHILDLGCGNGRTLLHLAQSRPNATFVGSDFIEGMIEAANSSNRFGKQIQFMVGDASQTELASKLGLSTYDFAYTKRLLINLKGDAKYAAVKTLHSCLKPGKQWLMTECFLEPLDKINAMRENLHLDKIKVHEFNEYLQNDFIEKISPWFRVVKEIDFESTYYFISRIFNAALSNGAPTYSAPINKVAVDLSLAGFAPTTGYSPERMILLERK